MYEMEVDDSPHQLEAYNNMMGSQLPDIMSRTLHDHNSHPSTSEAASLPLFQGGILQELHPLLKVEAVMDETLEPVGTGQEHHPPLVSTQVQLSDLELGPTWFSQQTYPTLVGARPMSTTALDSWPFLPCSAELTPPYSTYHYFDDSDGRSPWSSSPEFAHSQPLTSLGEVGEGITDKPYARLIYEALMQAPGHKMMLRDIYEWFRLNTTKPQESGSNGWQNSIRHNLSMNQAFENDRESSRSSARKANSVWMLTEDAIAHGVQSTTRYRKTGGARKVTSNRAPAIQRQRSGARGGRAARWAARQRRPGNSLHTEGTTPSCSPTTPSQSDVSEYQSFEYNELRPALLHWPMTPVDDSLHLADGAMQNMCLSPQRSIDASQSGHRDEGLHSEELVLRCLTDRQSHGSGSPRIG
ncbi:hypothetical protein ABEF95_012058 [Exophiala dermatitidis]|uniref:Fork-head domain-containing protein n=1 Tax=Exophiala dermatitidis (strain ATCC 34100 / CBS 525.76 / NIH/UT8656) TaxID=858893 RepID=H6BZ12_EXODN|nr:uncharacterized protein HMPREF1120_04939 [Exophiala dermatitidis NIH/UT8656]EHY56875.1 hypothetical protein HMPREF1120_04939 [Exophiala dermatitidis NIH/UT8656]